MSQIVGYALVIAVSAVMYFWLVYPEVHEAGVLWTQISEATDAH